jgi:hypothetical protein
MYPGSGPSTALDPSDTAGAPALADISAADISAADIIPLSSSLAGAEAMIEFIDIDISSADIITLSSSPVEAMNELSCRRRSPPGPTWARLGPAMADHFPIRQSVIILVFLVFLPTLDQVRHTQHPAGQFDGTVSR